MFAAMKSLLTDASRRRYALLAINCFNLETALHDGLRQHPDAELADLLRLMESACQEVVAEYLGWSGSAHKA